MYSMVCWLTDATKKTKADGITFEEFVDHVAFFFTQRHHEEGLKHIFELYDTEQKGYLDIYGLQRVCEELEIYLNQ